MTVGPHLDSLLQGAAHSKDKLIGGFVLPLSTETLVLNLSDVEMLSCITILSDT